MIPTLRAEFRKLFTVRSTYIISSIALLLIAFLSFYTEGYRAMAPLPEWRFLIDNVSTTVSIFVAIIAILLMGHEYRYNTITYTLTATNSRTKVLLAKICAVIAFAIGLTIVAWLLSAGTYWLGVQLSPNQIQGWLTPAWHWDALWRGLFFVVGFGLLALVLAFLFRHLVGAIAALFILPMIEGMLSPLLKENTKYLPFGLLDQVHTGMVWKPLTAALLFTAYLGVAWLLAWYLFLRRDAS